MPTSFLLTVVVSIVLCLVQFAAALPWLLLLAPGLLLPQLRRPGFWLSVLGGVAGAGVALAVFLSIAQDPNWLVGLGKVHGSLLHLQLVADAFVAVFALLLLVWPRGGAVALAAFREGLRQPMFWLLATTALVLMTLSPFLPYFTFGEDFKMVKELGYDLIMLAAVAFAVLAASMSISEEIEGRTAVTLMSKPVSRREFLLGKFVGILLAALVMTNLLGWYFDYVLWFKPWYDKETVADPTWLAPAREAWAWMGEEAANFLLGTRLWFAEAAAASPGLILGFCQVMVLLAIATALATRLPMVVNLVICLLLFFLGHLTPVLSQVSQQRFALVHFMAQLFDTLLPALEFFNVGPAIARDMPLPEGPFALYVVWVALYGVLYTIIALLFGLILFEDRDLA
jgi:ABC-type transport system involved in multi-copper enzyme maturation permease subunit